MWLAQEAPGVPDAGDLKDLPTPVAILLLCLIALLAVLYYFGGALRDRVSKTPPPSPPPETLASNGPGVATPAMTQATDLANRYIADLQARNQVLEDQARQQGREIRQLRDEVEQLRLEVQRLKYRRENGY